MLEVAREELRKALAVIIKTALARGLRLVSGALEVSWLLCGTVSDAALRKEVGRIKLVSPPR